jgi:hypothetical protein
MARSAIMHCRLYQPEWVNPSFQLRGCLLQCGTDEIAKIGLGCWYADHLMTSDCSHHGFLDCQLSLPERRCGQDAAPHWTNDLDLGVHRNILKAGETLPPMRSSRRCLAAARLLSCQCATNAW